MQTEMPMQVDITKSTSIVCEKCENSVFIQGVLLRKISKFITFTQKDALIPVPIFTCSKCGHVNVEFIPAELRELTQNS